MDNRRRPAQPSGTMQGMDEAPHPFDAIAFDGDGRSTPHVDPERVDADRRRWHDLNNVDVPTIAPPAR